jgi:hypothetical protein
MPVFRSPSHASSGDAQLKAIFQIVDGLQHCLFQVWVFHTDGLPDPAPVNFAVRLAVLMDGNVPLRNETWQSVKDVWVLFDKCRVRDLLETLDDRLHFLANGRSRHVFNGLGDCELKSLLMSAGGLMEEMLSKYNWAVWIQIR